MLYKFVVIIVLGAPALGLFIFEVLLNGSAMFNHANFQLPLWLDRIVRMVFVTPDMHRVHHSVIHRETDSNYGFNLSVWDRMFGTYIDQPSKGHDGMTIGLEDFQDDNPSRIGWSLLLPFRK
jgi:sterol desaturase/sphingolipid hydroxylase (fatty acid hydroxylase superfamily)